MSSWRCMTCRTVYAVGVEACPHCGSGDYSEGGVVAKASAEGGATHYVAEGDPVPDDLPEGVRLVGPGAPGEAEPEPDEAEAEVVPDPRPEEPAATPGPDSTPPASSAGSSAPGDGDDGPADYASYPVSVLRDLCKERGVQVTGDNGYAPKGELVARLDEWDAAQVRGR